VFQGWDNFFYLMGSAAAGLIGLLFVVATLNRNVDRSRALRGARIYLTPTAIVLSISAVALVPRLPVGTAAALFGLAAFFGLVQAIRACVGIRGGLHGAGSIDWSDFCCYGVAPTTIYLALGAAAVALGARMDWAVHATAALLLTLLLIGIRNAWDLVTWMAPRKDGGDGSERRSEHSFGANAMRGKAQAPRGNVETIIE
jgi:hypothetical protein